MGMESSKSGGADKVERGVEGILQAKSAKKGLFLTPKVTKIVIFVTPF
jgi:hypothetical protein